MSPSSGTEDRRRDAPASLSLSYRVPKTSLKAGFARPATLALGFGAAFASEGSLTIEIDDDLRAFLEGGVASVVATRDAERAPEVCRAWGLHAADRHTVAFCLGLPDGRRALDNLGGNGRVALTCVHPLAYRQVQLKGRLLGAAEASAEDVARIERHRQAFLRSVERLGLPAALTPGFWRPDQSYARVLFAVEEAYDQTPGPQAGRRL